MIQPNTVWVAMQLWLRSNEAHYKTQHDMQIMLVCEELIRDWSCAPSDTPIKDIIRLNGVTKDN